MPESPYPPPPWHLCGTALIFCRLMPIATVRHLVPPRLKIVSVLPGKTLGVLYVANYADSSVIRYRELIFAPVLAYTKGRVGSWISGIYVDDERAIAGGKAIWGLDKKMAKFEGSWEDGVIEVNAGRPVIRIAWNSFDKGLAVPLLAPALTVVGGVTAVFWTRGRASVQPIKACVHAAAHTSLAVFNGTAVRALNMHSLKLHIGAPR